MPTDRLDHTMYRLHRTLAIFILLIAMMGAIGAVVAYRTGVTSSGPHCDVVVYGDQQPKADYGSAVVCYRGDNGNDK